MLARSHCNLFYRLQLADLENPIIESPEQAYSFVAMLIARPIDEP